MGESDARGLESVVGNAQAPATLADMPDPTTVHRGLTSLMRKRVKKLVALTADVLGSGRPTDVHDVRVVSRRLQQVVGVLFPKPRSGKVRRLRRQARRIRRALGEWRNCDVVLEIVGKEQRRTRSAAKRRAWAFVRDYLLQKRSEEVARAGKKLLSQDLGEYAALAHRLLEQSPDEGAEVLIQRLQERVHKAWSEWQAALARAQETRAVEDLHAFRIATKGVRYRMEVLHDLGHGHVKAQLKWLAALQEALGVWHDRQVLQRAVAAAIARRDVLLNEVPTVRVLLAELESDRSRQPRDVEQIFRLATGHPGPGERESWSADHLLLAPDGRWSAGEVGEGETR